MARIEPLLTLPHAQIIEGSLRVGTPICVVKIHVDKDKDGNETKKKEIIRLGKVYVQCPKFESS